MVYTTQMGEAESSSAISSVACFCLTSNCVCLEQTKKIVDFSSPDRFVYPTGHTHASNASLHLETWLLY